MRKLAWLWGGRSRLRTRRGMIASWVTAVLIVVIAAAQRDPLGTAISLIVLSPLIWWSVWWLSGGLRGD